MPNWRLNRKRELNSKYESSRSLPIRGQRHDSAELVLQKNLTADLAGSYACPRRNMKVDLLPRLALIAIAALLLTGSQTVFAQLRIVGAVSGTVLDPTGAVVANAQVSLKDTKTGITKETTSKDNGTFLFPDLTSGTYELLVARDGFQKSLIPNVIVSTSQTTDIKITL
jgi:hypothetical protein